MSSDKSNLSWNGLSYQPGFDPTSRRVVEGNGTAVDSRDTAEWLANKVTLPPTTPEMLNDPLFEAIWQNIKGWAVNGPEAYHGYSGATGSHAAHIYKNIKKELDNV
jgi:hypothetical protein